MSREDPGSGEVLIICAFKEMINELDEKDHGNGEVSIVCALIKGK